MSETNESAARPVHTGKTLSLKKTETSTVKQSFSHGRTKAVVVEKKRARVAPIAKGPEPEKKTPAAAAPQPAPELPARQEMQSRAGVVLRQLTEEEKEARSRALADARVMEAEARKRADEEMRHRAVEEERFARERAAAEKRKAEEEARKAGEEAVRRHAEEEAQRRLEKT